MRSLVPKVDNPSLGGSAMFAVAALRLGRRAEQSLWGNHGSGRGFWRAVQAWQGSSSRLDSGLLFFLFFLSFLSFFLSSFFFCFSGRDAGVGFSETAAFERFPAARQRTTFGPDSATTCLSDAILGRIRDRTPQTWPLFRRSMKGLPSYTERCDGPAQ